MSEQVMCRTPIKIRKSIKKQFCNCCGIKVLNIDDNPSVILGDTLSVDTIKKMMETLGTMLTFYFTQDIDLCLDKINVVLDNNIPVWIKTSKTLPTDLIQKMGGVPHSAIHVPIGFLNDSVPNLLGKKSSSIKSLRKMMFLAKSLRIFVAVCIDYQPLIMKRFDILEMIEMNKMLARHILVSFPSIPDEYYHQNKDTWELIKGNCSKNLKSLYEPVYKDRAWVLKPTVKKQFIESLRLFIKNKKLTVEPFYVYYEDDTRIRYTSSKLSEFALGMKPFFYTRNRDTLRFEESTKVIDEICTNCNKSLFL